MSSPNLNQISNDLLKNCIHGDDRAFDEVVKKTQKDVYSLAFRWSRDRELAFDICQEVYVKFYKFLPKWDFSCTVKTWLYRVTTNVCIDYHRKLKHQFVSLNQDDTLKKYESRIGDEKQDNPRKYLETKECFIQVEKCISALPQRMQESFRLKYIGGLSLKEISEVQECSIGTVKASLHQAVKKTSEPTSWDPTLILRPPVLKITIQV